MDGSLLTAWHGLPGRAAFLGGTAFPGRAAFLVFTTAWYAVPLFGDGLGRPCRYLATA